MGETFCLRCSTDDLKVRHGWPGGCPHAEAPAQGVEAREPDQVYSASSYEKSPDCVHCGKHPSEHLSRLICPEGVREGVEAPSPAKPHPAMLALEGLTPGGSEYVGDVARCVEYVRHVIDSKHQMIVKLMREKKAAAPSPGVVEGLRWTREKPNQEGTYWVRFRDSGNVTTQNVFRHDSGKIAYSDWECDWAGPIPEPAALQPSHQEGAKLDIIPSEAVPPGTVAIVQDGKVTAAITNLAPEAKVEPQGVPTGAATCAWSNSDPDGSFWETACGRAWTFTTGDVQENEVKFCMGCGKPVEDITKAPDPDEDDEAAPAPREADHG